MDEDRKFSGQPVLSQILNVIPGSVIHAANRKHKANRYYKRLPVRIHLVSLLYGVFSYCNGLREICEGMLACEGKLAHLGLDKALPAVRSQMPITKEATGSLKRSITDYWPATIPLSRTAG